MSQTLTNEKATGQQKPDPIVEASRLFAALADPTRLRILRRLVGGEANVAALTALLGVPQPTTSHHLAILLMNRLVVRRRAGKLVFYSLHDDVVDANGISLLGQKVRVEF